MTYTLKNQAFYRSFFYEDRPKPLRGPRHYLIAILLILDVSRWHVQANAVEEDFNMEISARNQLRGKVTAISLGGVMAEVRLDLGGQELVAVITRASTERLGLKVGHEVVAIIKATEVMVGKP